VIVESVSERSRKVPVSHGSRLVLDQCLVQLQVIATAHKGIHRRIDGCLGFRQLGEQLLDEVVDQGVKVNRSVLHDLRV